jgi:hypothetical protein
MTTSNSMRVKPRGRGFMLAALEESESSGELEA